jgi:hypothetical protein
MGDIPVWRYLSLPKFISLLKSDSLYLARLDKLTDPFEGSLTVKTVEAIDKSLKALGTADGFQSIANVYRESQKSTYICCWHANECESEAMWRLYGGLDGGVAIRSTYADLANSIEHAHTTYLGLVSYIDYASTVLPNANLFTPVMHKRVSFSHEREVRLVRYEPLHLGATDGPADLSVPWSVDRYCKGIYVNPYAPEFYFDAVKTVVEALRPELSDRITWSQMRAIPTFGPK